MSLIAPKFDWYSAIWQNSSLADVFDYYGDFFDIGEHWHNVYEETKIASFECIALNTPLGVSIRIDRPSMVSAFPDVEPDQWQFIDPCDVWNKQFAKIKIDFTGSGLDYLRSICDIDSLIRVKPDLSYPHEMHITRLDVAFDFIDYGSHIVSDLQRFLMDPCRTLLMRRPDVVYAGKQNAMKYQLRFGSEMTIYLGSTASDKLLRIYDKRYQLEGKDIWDLDHVPYRSDSDPDSLPNSWVRFEMQLRRGEAHDMLFSELDYFEMLHYLFDHFAFRSEKGGTFIDLWKQLFAWDKVKSYMIQKVHFVQSETPLEKTSRVFLPMYCKSLFLLCCYQNNGYLSKQVSSYMNRLRKSTRDCDRHRYNHILRFARFAKGVYEDPPYLYFDKTGDLYFDYSLFSDSNSIIKF